MNTAGRRNNVRPLTKGLERGGAEKNTELACILKLYIGSSPFSRVLENADSRYHAAIDQNTSLELHQVRMLAIVEGILADLRRAPTMDGNVEVSTRVN